MGEIGYVNISHDGWFLRSQKYNYASGRLLNFDKGHWEHMIPSNVKFFHIKLAYIINSVIKFIL